LNKKDSDTINRYGCSTHTFYGTAILPQKGNLHSGKAPLMEVEVEERQSSIE
jgi:hypothetical protein